MINLVMQLCLLANPSACREMTIQFSPFMSFGLATAPVMAEVDIKEACLKRAQGRMADPKNPVLRYGEYVAKYSCTEASRMVARI